MNEIGNAINLYMNEIQNGLHLYFSDLPENEIKIYHLIDRYDAKGLASERLKQKKITILKKAKAASSARMKEAVENRNGWLDVVHKLMDGAGAYVPVPYLFGEKKGLGNE